MSHLPTQAVEEAKEQMLNDLLTRPALVEFISQKTGLATAQQVDEKAKVLADAVEVQDERIGELETDLSNGLAGKVDDDDPRLSDPRSPTAHKHALGDVTGLQEALGGKVASNDPRLTDDRKPLAHKHTFGDITEVPEATTTNRGVTWFAGDGSETAGRAVQATDSRLKDSRAPKAHKSTHAAGGSDALTPADIGAAATAHGHAIGDVTGLQGALEGKAPTVHTHTASSISDFAEAAQDAVLSVIADSSDIDATYNDAGNLETLVLTPTGIAAGTYNSLTIDAKGRATAGTALGVSQTIVTTSRQLTLAESGMVIANFAAIGGTIKLPDAPANNLPYSFLFFVDSNTVTVTSNTSNIKRAGSLQATYSLATNTWARFTWDYVSATKQWRVEL